jgi:exodeoxyribonuclease-3
MGWAPFDDEGRYIEARYGNLSVVSFYIPSGSSGELRQGFKFEVMDWLNDVCIDAKGWVDSYRTLHPQGEDYTWWSNRGAARAKNVGWRIDYQFVTPSLRKKLKSCSIAPVPRFSDHAPYTVDYAQ